MGAHVNIVLISLQETISYPIFTLSNLKNKAMKHISSILPRTVLEKYIEMYEGDNKWPEAEYKHWTYIFGVWMTKILHASKTNHPEDIPLSLNKINWAGKKTRALLAVLEIKEPKTLTELKKTFTEYYGQLNNIS